MRRALIAALILASLGSPAKAAGLTVIGAGLTTCGRWTADTRANPARGDIQGLQFALGYLARSSLGSSRDLLKQTDAAAIRGWLDNYCAARPLSGLFEAIQALEDELVKRTPVDPEMSRQ